MVALAVGTAIPMKTSVATSMPGVPNTARRVSAPIPETATAHTEYSHSNGRCEASIPMMPTVPAVTKTPIRRDSPAMRVVLMARVWTRVARISGRCRRRGPMWRRRRTR
ncbi:hypothetical protein SAMN05216489_09794 [Streptomyces sp. 3213]|nr:hypothetical protein SAMN05216489_09794 [Streptomyces sp. 3213] [Streptomyces sp. 3213.3]